MVRVRVWIRVLVGTDLKCSLSEVLKISKLGLSTTEAGRAFQSLIVVGKKESFLRESNPRFPYKSTVNIILMNSSVHMLKQSKNS